MGALLTPARLLLGALLLAGSIDHFLGSPLLAAEAHTPGGAQLLDAVHFSRIIHVAAALHLVAGAALLANRFVPLALAAALPVTVCAAFWAVVLEGNALLGLLAVVALALFALLMFAHLPAYAGMLQRHALAQSEGPGPGDHYETLYANPAGQTPPRAFALALLPIVGAAAFYHFIVPSMLAFYCLVVLLWPLIVLMLRTLQALLVQPERED